MSMDSDFAFHWEGGGDDFAHLHVVRFDIRDAISAPFEASLLLHARKAGDDVDPCDLVGRLGTLRIATTAVPELRAFHGLIVSAEDRGATRHGSLFEVVMAPPLVRAAHRKRSRIFHEKTTREIVEAVLKGDPKMTAGDGDGSRPTELRGAFSPPVEKFAWRLATSERVDDLKARPYAVQYEESDLDFIARILEEEGISYHFEHTDKQVVLVMSDSDAGRHRLDPFDALSAERPGRHLESMRMGGRLRPTKVKLLDYNWHKPKLDVGAEAKGAGEDLFVHAYPGRHRESAEHGAPLARALLERFQTEARHASASGSCRLLGAGTIFRFEHPVERFDGEYLVTKARLRGMAHGELPPGHRFTESLPDEVPFHCEVELVGRGKGKSAQESRFRPARATPKPHIQGTQTATVADDPGARGAEIHVGGPDGNENGCVRLKFPWDTETDRHGKEPTSKWVRVSQLFAGAGGGAVAHPRVGTEVIVSYENGDPDMPIVVGRVYNGVQPAPALGKGAATVTTMKSMSSPGGKVCNEFQFNDTAGKEQVNLTAGKDWNSSAGNDRTESIKNNSTSDVGVDRSESTGGNRTTTVKGNNSEAILGNESVSVTADQTVSVSANQTIAVAAARKLIVGGPHTISVGAAEEHSIAAAHSLSVGAGQKVGVGASKEESVAASYALKVGAIMSIDAGGMYTLKTPNAHTDAPVCSTSSAVWSLSASAATIINTTSLRAVAGGAAEIMGATVTIGASGDVTISGANVSIKGGNISLEAGSIKIAGGSVDITGGTVKVN
jgi:type VI secretion system secreted protein VgrG